MTPELLFKVGPGSNWKNASVCLLAKEVFRPLCSTSILEEGEGPEDFSSLQVNCSGARRKYSVQELRKARPELCLPEKSGGKGSFGLVRCLDGVAGTGERGLTGDGDGGIGVTPYKCLGKISDILHLNNKNNQLERRVRPPKDIH